MRSGFDSRQPDKGNKKPHRSGFLLGSRLYGCLCFDRCQLLSGLVLGLDAVGTDLDSLAVDAGPLEVRIFALFAGRVVVTTQKYPVIYHAGAFLTLWALGSHI